MKWTLLLATAACLWSASVAHAEITTDFESFPLASGYQNNAGASGFFEIDGHQFNNSYLNDPQWGDFWSDFAISQVADGTNPGFGNQYAAFPGSGSGGSQKYAVAFVGANGAPDSPYANSSFINLAVGLAPLSIDVANTTYAALSMRDGDTFTGAFGPGDFLKLDITGYDSLGGVGNVVDVIELYLADFTGGKNEILADWLTLDLSSLLGSKSLRFGLTTSDFGVFGMNTPAYVAIDNLRVGTADGPGPDPAAVPEPGTLLILSGGLLIGAIHRRKLKSKQPAPLA
jgi:hypothetical protein